MKKLQNKITGVSLDSSRNSKYYELNSDIQDTKSTSQSSLSIRKESNVEADSGYSAFESSDLLNDALSVLRADTPHMFHDSESSITLVMILSGAAVDIVYSLICQPESYINLSPHIVCVSFKENSTVTTKGGEKTKIKMDMTVTKKRLFFWDKRETLDGYFLLPPPVASPAKHASALRAPASFSSPKIMELHTQDSRGGEIRYHYTISDHPEGTKIVCRVTEEKRVILQSSKRLSSSGDASNATFQKARSRIYDFFSKSKINLVGREQKTFMMNFKDHLQDISCAPNQFTV